MKKLTSNLLVTLSIASFVTNSNAGITSSKHTAFEIFDQFSPDSNPRNLKEILKYQIQKKERKITEITSKINDTILKSESASSKFISYTKFLYMENDLKSTYEVGDFPDLIIHHKFNPPKKERGCFLYPYPEEHWKMNVNTKLTKSQYYTYLSEILQDRKQAFKYILTTE